MRAALLSLLVVLIASLSISSMSFAGTDAALQGTWRPNSAKLGGAALPEEIRKSITLVINDDTYFVTVGTAPDKGTCKVDSTTNPKSLDITGTEGPNKGKTILAIYECSGDTLRVCYDLSGQGRPTAFKSDPGTQLFLVTYQRDHAPTTAPAK